MQWWQLQTGETSSERKGVKTAGSRFLPFFSFFSSESDDAVARSIHTP
jgi:hypothetical protein